MVISGLTLERLSPSERRDREQTGNAAILSCFENLSMKGLESRLFESSCSSLRAPGLAERSVAKSKRARSSLLYQRGRRPTCDYVFPTVFIGKQRLLRCNSTSTTATALPDSPHPSAAPQCSPYDFCHLCVAVTATQPCPQTEQCLSVCPRWRRQTDGQSGYAAARARGTQPTNTKLQKQQHVK